MKIAVWHNLPSGGGKRALYDHVRGLVARGHTVEAWCPPTADQTYLPLRDLVPEHIVPYNAPKMLQGKVGRFFAPYKMAVQRLQAMEQHCRECAEAIHQGGFDLVFANSCQFHATPSLARFVRIPSVLYLQEPYRWLYEATQKLPWWAYPPPEKSGLSPRYLHLYLYDLCNTQGLRIQAREEAINARAFDTILVNSHFSRESILRAYGVDARVCYLGVDTDLFTDRRRDREDYVIGLGAFTVAKNIRLVIEALAVVRPPRPKLIWVGNLTLNSYLEEMQALAREKQVDFEPRVRVDDDELIELLNRARMMVYCPRLEPFGLAPLEANACGTPVIAAAEGGVRETILDRVNGLLVESSPSSLADAIAQLRDDSDFACQLGQTARRLVADRWTLEASIDRLEGRLEETLREVGQRPSV